MEAAGFITKSTSSEATLVQISKPAFPVLVLDSWSFSSPAFPTLSPFGIEFDDHEIDSAPWVLVRISILLLLTWNSYLYCTARFQAGTARHTRYRLQIRSTVLVYTLSIR
jgi:hypothetical protein